MCSCKGIGVLIKKILEFLLIMDRPKDFLKMERIIFSSLASLGVATSKRIVSSINYRCISENLKWNPILSNPPHPA